MEKMIVKIESKDMVKPCSPTPNHLKTLQLSSIDQYANPVWMPCICYYNQTTPVNQNRSTLLKKSLSETLVQFYPLAGRLVGNISIDCNDQGVLFYEASVLCRLVQVLENPNPDELLRLLPFLPRNNTHKQIVVGVQVNHFSCGGMAISVCFSHKIVDASTIDAFVNAWARKARGDSDNNQQVIFDSVSLFPQIQAEANNNNNESEDSIVISTEKIVTRRLVFDKERLDVLKKRCGDGLGRGPSRVEAIVALLWKQFIKAARGKAVPPQVSVAYLVVGLKKIKSTPVPENYYGNLYWTTFTYAPVGTETEYHEAEVVAKLRETVKQIDKSFIGKIQTGEAFEESQKVYETFSQETVHFCGFSDCTKVSLYEANFGWGTPIWVSMTSLPFKNTVFFMNTKCGQGIEAWVNVPEQDVAALELDHHFP